MFVSPGAALHPSVFWPLDQETLSRLYRGANPAAEGAKPHIPGSGTTQQHPLFLSDILYPSVIPLAGTLPHSPGSRSVDSDHGSDKCSPSCSPVSGVASSRNSVIVIHPQPNTRSSELKFGIDRILSDKEEDEKEDHHTKEKDNEVEHKKAFTSVPKSHTLPIPTLRSPKPYPLLRYPHPSHHGYPMLGGGLQGYTMGHHLAQIHGYNQHRQAEFPGPYSVLGSSQNTSIHHQNPKRKRSWSRAVFSALQRKGLEKRFEVQKYVTKPDRRQLAAMLGLTDAQVKVWFQNRRMKWRHTEEQKKKRDSTENSMENTYTSPAKCSSESMEISNSVSNTNSNNINETDDESDEIIVHFDEDDDDDDDDKISSNLCIETNNTALTNSITNS